MPDRMLDLGTKSINETEFDMLWMSVCVIPEEKLLKLVQ